MSFAYLPFYTGDYFRDTRGLSMAGHGCYILMLTYYWDSKGPLPLDEERIAGICEARNQEERLTMQRILQTYFVRMEDGWYNHRMQLEIERAETLSRKFSDSGRKGYEARAKNLNARLKGGISEADAKASIPNPNPIPSPTPERKDKPSPAKAREAAQPEGFAEFWALYPRKENKKNAIDAWRKLKPDPELRQVIAVAIAWRLKSEAWLKQNGDLIPHPTTWLNGRRWEDEPTTLVKPKAWI